MSPKDVPASLQREAHAIHGDVVLLKAQMERRHTKELPPLPPQVQLPPEGELEDLADLLLSDEEKEGEDLSYLHGLNHLPTLSPTALSDSRYEEALSRFKAASATPSGTTAPPSFTPPLQEGGHAKGFHSRVRGPGSGFQMPESQAEGEEKLFPIFSSSLIPVSVPLAVSETSPTSLRDSWSSLDTLSGLETRGQSLHRPETGIVLPSPLPPSHIQVQQLGQFALIAGEMRLMSPASGQVMHLPLGVQLMPESAILPPGVVEVPSLSDGTFLLPDGTQLIPIHVMSNLNESPITRPSPPPAIRKVLVDEQLFEAFYKAVSESFRRGIPALGILAGPLVLVRPVIAISHLLTLNRIWMTRTEWKPL